MVEFLWVVYVTVAVLVGLWAIIFVDTKEWGTSETVLSIMSATLAWPILVPIWLGTKLRK